MMKTTNYTGHDKRVTLNLALHSAAATEKPELMEALSKLPSVGWNLDKLEQVDIEHIYAEFDQELEDRIKDEFEADPAFLIDLGHAGGVCPLCGHIGIRWVFRINNHKGGKSVECGSDCIVQHGLHVKGSETSDHARKALESAIRKRIRALSIEAWHKEYNFKEELFSTLRTALVVVRKNADDYWVRNKSYYLLRDLSKLEKFYAKNGWLGTEKRWTEWCRIAKFARVHSEAAREDLPFPKPWVSKKTKAEKKEPVMVEAKNDTPPVVAEAPKQMGMFHEVAQQLVFGEAK